MVSPRVSKYPINFHEIAMSPEDELLRARMNLVAHEFLLDWMAESYEFLLKLSSPDVRSRARKAMKERLQTSRQDQTDMQDDQLPPEQAKLQAALFREAFDEAAQKIEAKLGLPES